MVLGGGGRPKGLTNGPSIHRDGKPDAKQPWEIHKFPSYTRESAQTGMEKSFNIFSSKTAVIGRAGVTQKLIWRLVGQERRDVPRSKLAPTHPGRQYMRRETPHRAKRSLATLFGPVF